MEIGIFWSTNADIEVLYHYLFAKNKRWNEFELFFNEPKLKLFTSKSDIINDKGEVNVERINKCSALFILAELEWGNHSLIDFHGINIVQHLRLNDINVPIFICSFVNEEYLIQEMGYLILQSMGHYFIHLPSGIVNDYKVRSLDQIELKDIKFHFCDLVGIIRTKFHFAKQEADRIIKANPEGYIEAKKLLLKEFRQLLIYPDLPPKVSSEITNLIYEIETLDNSTSFNEIIKKEESLLLSYFDDKETSSQIIKKRLEWELLLLDDYPEEAIDFIKLLETQNIKVHIAKTYLEAKNLIDEDKNNKIAVVVSDYRLEDENRNYKAKQGYSFVEWLSKQSRFNEIFVLSHLSRNFLKETFYSYSIRVQIESKSNIRGRDTEKLYDFVNKLIESGNQICELVHNLPTTIRWKEMDLFYAHYRKIPGYFQVEKEISIESRNIIQQIENLRDTAEVSGLSEEDLQTLPLFSGIKTFPNLTGRLCNPVKDESTKHKPELFRLIYNEKSNEYDPYLFQDPSIPKYFSYFKNKMIARRIAWWLIFIEGLNSNTVYSLLMKGEYVNKNAEKETNDAKTLINTRLAIKKEDFPANLLMEEKAWFKYEMGVDLNDFISIISGFQDYFTNVFETFLPKMNRKNNEFVKLNEYFIYNEQFLFHTANDIRKATELSIVTMNDSKDVVSLLDGLVQRLNFEDKICFPYFKSLEKYILSQYKKHIKRS